MKRKLNCILYSEQIFTKFHLRSTSKQLINFNVICREFSLVASNFPPSLKSCVDFRPNHIVHSIVYGSPPPQPKLASVRCVVQLQQVQRFCFRLMLTCSCAYMALSSYTLRSRCQLGYFAI